MNSNKKFISPLLFFLLAFFTVNAQDSSWQYTPGGMPYRYYPGTGDKILQKNKFMKFHVRQLYNDSLMFDSHKNMLPLYQEATGIIQPYDISELFDMPLKKGDSIVAWQLLDTFIMRQPQLASQFRKGDKVYTFLSVLEIFDSPDAYKADEKTEKGKFSVKEEDEIRKYLQENNIKALRKGSGLYFRMVKKGTGTLAAVKGAEISVAYKGLTLKEGRQFDTNMDETGKVTQPLKFTQGEGQMIQGFDEGLTGLKKGDKAVLYLPSMLAYGAQSPSPEIKPFDNLIFEVTVLDVKMPVKKTPAVAPKAPFKKGVQKKPVAKPKTPVKKN